MKRLRLVASRMLMVFGGLLVGLLFAEFILRFVFYKPLQTEGAFTMPDPYLGWRHQPNWDGRFFVEGRTVPIKFDECGLRRSTSVATPKPKDVKRVLFIGDSLTAAFEVPEEKTFVALLEQRLNARGGQKWEAINGGVRGYGADQELVWLTREGFALEPDVVVYDFCHNDLTDNLKTKIKCNYTLDGDRLGELRLPDYDWLKRKHFWKYLYVRRLWRLKGFRDRQPPRLATEESRKRYSDWCAQLKAKNLDGPDWKLLGAIIQRMGHECRRHGAQFYVIPGVMPFEYDDALLAKVDGNRHRDGDDPFKAHERLAALCRRSGAKFVKTIGPFREHYRRSHGESLWWEADNHYNEKGHELTARVLFEALSHADNEPVARGG